MGRQEALAEEACRFTIDDDGHGLCHGRFTLPSPVGAMLGGKSEILDQGRGTRFHTKAQRIAIAHRDRHCTADGCECPAAACHVHHNEPWSRGVKPP